MVPMGQPLNQPLGPAQPNYLYMVLFIVLIELLVESTSRHFIN